MKIDKTKPLHWLYLIWIGSLLLFFLPFRLIPIKNKRSKRIILYGHKLHGNLHSLYINLTSEKDPIKKYDCFFLTMDPEYYREIKTNNNILLALNPLHLYKIILSDCFVTDHGLHIFILLMRFTNIKFVDVWHGIPFKGFIPADFRLQHKYDQVWVSSKLLQNLYIEKFGFKKEKIFITGYGRTDILLRYYNEKDVYKKSLQIPLNKKVVLFAPTWKQDSKKRNEIPFNMQPEMFLLQLQNFAKNNNAFLIVRFHLNTSQTNQLEDSCTKYMPLSSYPDSEMIISLSDILITDWSSIAFDMMVINKPIVFLDVPPPFKNGFSLTPDFRAGYLAKNLDELLEALSEICDSDDHGLIEQKNYQVIKNLVYDNTLDGQSSLRYINRLEMLLINDKLK